MSLETAGGVVSHAHSMVNDVMDGGGRGMSTSASSERGRPLFVGL